MEVKVEHAGSCLFVYNVRQLTEDMLRVKKSMKLKFADRNKYQFLGNSYEVIHITKGGYDSHHYTELKIPDETKYKYDDMERNGVSLPCRHFTSHDDIEYLVLRKL